MKQSETNHALKFRITELEEELKQVKDALEHKGAEDNASKEKTKNISVKDLLSFEDILKFGRAFSTTDSESYVKLEQRNVGSLARHGIWLGGIDYYNGYVPEVRIDTNNQFVLVLTKPKAKNEAVGDSARPEAPHPRA